MNKTISSKIGENRTWEKSDFKEDQENTRKTSTKQYEAIVNEQMASVVKNVCNEVNEKCNIKESDDSEDTRFGQQVKQKPMNQIRQEAEERAYLLSVANKDKDKLHNFIRLVDYMTIEVLVDINFASVKTFMDEMRKERKTGLFNISINEQQMTFMPDEEEILDLIETTLKDMIEIVKGIPRFIREFKEYLKFNQGEDDRMDNIADIGKIITRSVEYIAIKNEMQ